MEVERGNVAGVAVFVGSERVDAIGGAIVHIFWGWVGDMGNLEGVVVAINEPWRPCGLTRCIGQLCQGPENGCGSGICTRYEGGIKVSASRY